MRGIKAIVPGTRNLSESETQRGALRSFLRASSALFATSVLGCGNGAESTGDAIRITLWTQTAWLGVTGHELDDVPLDDPRRSGYAYGDWYAKTGRDFDDLHPEVDIQFDIEVLDWISGYQKLDIAVASGLPPDIMISTSGTALKYAPYGLLETFDEFVTEADVADFGPFYAFGEYAGKHYFLPFIGGGCYLVANRNIFRERGAEHLLPVEGDRLWTFDEFLEAAKAVTFDRDGDGKVDVYGFAMPFQRDAPEQEQMPFFWSHGAFLFNPEGDTLIIDSEAGVEALQFMVDLEREHGVMPPGSAGLRRTDVTDLWNLGRVAMRMGHEATLISHELALKTGAIAPGVIDLYPMMYPSKPGIAPRVFVVADSPCVFKQSDPAKRRLVMEFVRFMTDTERERQVAYALSTLPTRKSALDVWPDHPFQQYVMRVSKYGVKDAIQGYNVPLRNMVRSALQAAMSGELSPRRALDDLVRRGNRFIARDIVRRRRAWSAPSQGGEEIARSQG